MGNYNDAREVQDKLTELERRMRAVETVSRVESASVGSGGISVYEGGTVDFVDGGSLQVGESGAINIHGGSLSIRGTGQMTVDGTAEFKSTTQLKGNTTFGGALNISSGSLVLPSGSIDSAALSEQLEVKYARTTDGEFGLSTSWSTLVTTSVTAPSWATKATVMMTGFYIAKYTGQGYWGAKMSGRCAGAVIDDSTTVLAYNESGIYGNIGRNSWSTNLTNPSGTISCNVMGKADQSGEMNNSTSSWAEVAMIAIFMR